MKNKLKIPSALQWAWQRCAAVMLCMVLVFFGCKEDKNAQKMDEKSFVESMESAPVVIADKGELTDWLQGIIDSYESGFGTGRPVASQFYRGTSNGRVVYYIRLAVTSCPMCHFYHENGENIVWSGNGLEEVENFLSTCKDWVLIYQIGDYPFQTNSKSGLSDIARLSVVDKFEFPDISHLNDLYAIGVIFVVI